MRLLIPYSLVQASLLLQMVLWVKLYDTKYSFGNYAKYLFYLGGAWSYAIVDAYSVQIGFFTVNILKQYVLYILLAVSIYHVRFNFKQAICLGFLTVFLNSFFWEFFYHIYEFQIWLPISLGFQWWYVRFPQWIRIVPAFFLVNKFKIKKTSLIQVGLVFSFTMTYIKFFIWRRWYWLQPIHRLTCLLLLIATIYINDIDKGKGEPDEV